MPIDLHGAAVLLGLIIGEDKSEAPEWLTDLVKSRRFEGCAGVAS